MGRKRYTVEQIFRKLREAEVELAKGSKTPQVCRKQGISEQTFYRWRKQYGGMQVGQARLKELERENARLKKLLTEAMLGCRKVGPSQKQVRREAGRDRRWVRGAGENRA